MFTINTIEYDLTYTINLVPIGMGTYYGFTITRKTAYVVPTLSRDYIFINAPDLESDHRFVLSDCTVTHNTVMGLYIACKLKRKTLVIVNKTFLLDQWIERAEQFTNAKIGIIQGKTLDIDDKDLVIGMVQSISMKEYDDSIFDQFGTVIYDECHHYAAKVFSNTLKKTGAKYILALSATPYRTDGLIDVIHWYLGNFIHREKFKVNNQVITKIYNYASTHAKFAEKKRWYAGSAKPDPIKMLTNICDIDQRRIHIANVIINCIRKDSDRKLLILSGRKQYLRELKELVDKYIVEDLEKGTIKDKINTYFFIGDMKDKERQEAIKLGDIFFGTYEMANEGLDIDRLNTIVLATPKKDVVQAVGRVMRKVLQDGDIRPLVIDFKDDLSLFPNWAKFRERHYKKCQYIRENYYLYNEKVVTELEYDKLNSKEIQYETVKDLGIDSTMEVCKVQITIKQEDDDDSELERRYASSDCSDEQSDEDEKPPKKKQDDFSTILI
jgi:superfamily II DNA or RNA helicase